MYRILGFVQGFSVHAQVLLLLVNTDCLAVVACTSKSRDNTRYVSAFERLSLCDVTCAKDDIHTKMRIPVQLFSVRIFWKEPYAV